MCTDAPDTSKQQEAAMMTAQMSKEQLEWAKELYANSAPQRQAAEQRAAEVSDLQMGATKKAMSLADEYADYNRTTFQPLEKSIVEDAARFDTEGERERMAGQAQADVAGAFGRAREDTGISLSRMGIDPNSGRAMAVGADLATNQALAEAGGKNRARQQAVTLANARKMDAASLGRNLASNQATQASLAMNTGNSAVGNANAVMAPGQQAQAALGTAYNGARAGYGQAGNLYGNIANGQAAADAANTSSIASGVGAIAGAAALMF